MNHLIYKGHFVKSFNSTFASEKKRINMTLSILAYAIASNSNIWIFSSCVFITTLVAFGKYIIKAFKHFFHAHKVLSYNDDDFYVGCQDIDGDDL